MARLDVHLLCMPGATIRWPSLGLGLLRTVLRERGFACELSYANLRFAQAAGLRVAVKAENNWNTEHLCDWLFQRVLFPGRAVSVEEYVRDYAGGGRLEPTAFDALCEERRDWRRSAETFLNDLCDEVVRARPLAVGFSLGVTQLFACLALLRLIKQAAPDIVAIVGGPSCETVGAEDLHRTFPELIDYAVSGEAEHVVGPLLEGVRRHGRELDARAVPYGVIAPTHREVGYPRDPSFFDKVPRAVVYDLDVLPAPDHSDYYDCLNSMPEIAQAVTKVGVFESSRGCGRGEKSLCHFCGDCGAMPTFRRKSADKVWEELRSMQKRFGVKKFVSTDNMLPPEFHETLLPRLVQESDKLSLFYEIRPTISREEARRLKAAGVGFVQAGVESLHTKALRSMNKGVAAWRNIQCLKWCRQFGLAVSWFIITCAPGELDVWNEEQAARIPFLLHLPPPRFVGSVRPDRHSTYYRRAQEFGLDVQVKPRYARLFDLDLNNHCRFIFHLEDAKTVRRKQDPLDFAFRPGLVQLERAVNLWRAVSQKRRPRLDMRREGEVVLITDTRFKEAREHELVGLTRDVLLFCDAGPTRRELVAHFGARGVGESEVIDAVVRLEASRLAMFLDGRVVSVVLEEPCAEALREEDLPVGWIAGCD